MYFISVLKFTWREYNVYVKSLMWVQTLCLVEHFSCALAFQADKLHLYKGRALKQDREKL